MVWVYRAFIALFVVLAISFWALRTPDTNRKEMVAKYSDNRSKFLDTPEGLIHYRDEGLRDGPVMLLLHGSSSSLHTWEPLVRLLEDRYRLISFDMPGHGLTGPSKSANYSAPALVKSATDVLDATGVESATWVGSSMGGWVAWRAGLAVPNRVKGLVLIGAVGAETGQEFKPYLGARIAKTWLGGKVMPAITPIWLVRTSVEESMADPAQVTDALVMRYWELLRLPGNRQAVVDRERIDREPGIWAEIGSLRKPTLLLWGNQDNIVPLAFGKAFESAINGATLVVMDKTGHLPMEERPEDTASTIDGWLNASILNDRQTTR